MPDRYLERIILRGSENGGCLTVEELGLLVPKWLLEEIIKGKHDYVFKVNGLELIGKEKLGEWREKHPDFRYMWDVKQRKRIKDDETIRLFELREKCKDDRKRREIDETIFAGSLYIVPSYARRYAKAGVDIEDLMQIGALCVWNSIETFEYKRGFTFFTYVRRRIVSAMMRESSRQLQLIRLPAQADAIIKNIEREEERFKQQTGREEVSSSLIAQRLHMWPGIVDMYRRSLSPITPIEEVLGNCDEYGKVINYPTPADIVADLDEWEQLKMRLNCLNKRERFIISERFGLYSHVVEPVRAIGVRLGISGMRVIQLETRALRKLRHPSLVRSLYDCRDGIFSKDSSSVEMESVI